MTLPTEKQLIDFLEKVGEPVSKNELARAFKVSGDERPAFKTMLREMAKDSKLRKQPGGGYSLPDGLPAVGVIEVTDVTLDGDVYGRPAQWAGNEGAKPRVEIVPDRKGHPALAKGDRILARLQKDKGGNTARTIRRLDTPENRVLGVIERQGKGFILVPTNKKNRNVYDIPEADLNGAQKGQIVVAEVQPGRGMRQTQARVAEVIGAMHDPKAISLIAIHEMGLRSEFSAAVIDETKGMAVPGLKGREDLRQMPLVTIDPVDARDRDDAVYAEKLDDGGFRLTVAIADVAHYVRHGSALDKEAFARGNSTYFPDRVVPMLPEQLSNNLCSLAPNEDRACIAVHMRIDAEGQLQDYKFVRGLMNSVAALSYEQAQAAMKDGITDDVTAPLRDPVLMPLFEAYKILRAAREKRGALDLNLPERRIVVDENGNMTGVKKREHFEAHEVIEEMMVLANVAAASALEDKTAPCVYRVHDKPTPQKLESLGEYLSAFGFNLPKDQSPKPGQLNQILKRAADHPHSHLVSDAILRSQAQAIYSPENIGHYGLGLRKYAHFTSPIRRYADLIVHRSLISAFNLGSDGLRDAEVATLATVAQHVSETERTSAQAERNAVDRFTAAYLSQHLGAQFAGRIRGVTRFGLFVELDDTGADGFVPVRMLPRDQYVHDERRHALIGRHSGRVFRLGASVTATVVDADRTNGSTILELAGAENGADIPGADFGDAGTLPQHGGGRRSGGKNRHGGGHRRGGGPRHGR